jgi:hypothetical protein
MKHLIINLNYLKKRNAALIILFWNHRLHVLFTLFWATSSFVQHSEALQWHVPPFASVLLRAVWVVGSVCSTAVSVFRIVAPTRSCSAGKWAVSPRTNSVSFSATGAPSCAAPIHASTSPTTRCCASLNLSAIGPSESTNKYLFDTTHLLRLQLLSFAHCLVYELEATTMARPVLLDLSSLFLCLELFLLVHFFLEHLLESLVVLCFAEHARALLRPDVPSQVLLFLLLPESDAVGDQLQLLLQFPSALPQLAQTDGL